MQILNASLFWPHANFVQRDNVMWTVSMKNNKLLIVLCVNSRHASYCSAGVTFVILRPHINPLENFIADEIKQKQHRF